MPATGLNPAFRSLAAIGGLIAAAAAGIVAIFLALVFAATLVTIGIIGAVLLVLAGLAMRARRWMKAEPVKSTDADIIEAHRVGGHSWVAYGWDNRQQ